MEFQLTTDPRPPTAHLVAAGELDIYTVRQVASAVRRMLDAGCRDLSLDLSAVSFLDAAALGSLLRSAALTHDHHGTFRVVAAGRPVTRLCEMTGLTGAFGMAEAV